MEIYYNFDRKSKYNTKLLHKKKPTTFRVLRKVGYTFIETKNPYFYCRFTANGFSFFIYAFLYGISPTYRNPNAPR